jgi:branched-chain amino acid transport system substrate-binding protein
MRIRSFVASAALAGAALIVPLGLAAQTAAPIKIPAILSLTGYGAFPSQGDRQSMLLIEALVNRTGGIGPQHRPIHFDITDDGSNPQTAVQLQNQILASKAPIMLGPGLTQQCNAAAPLVRDNGPAQYCLSPAIHPAPGGYIWSTSVSLRDDIIVEIRYLRLLGLKRMAILSSTDATGQESDHDFDIAKSLPENKSVEFVAREHFNLTDVSVAAQMTRIKAANPQVLLTSTVGPAFGTELHGITDAGLDVPVVASNGDMVTAQIQSYKAFVPKKLIFAGVLASVQNAVGPGPVKDAQKVYFDAFKAAGIKPEFTNTLGWDPTMIVLDAIRHLGPNATPQKYRDYINGLHGFAGIDGIYDFRDGSGHGIGQNAVIMMRWDAATGEFKQISKRNGLLK